MSRDLVTDTEVAARAAANMLQQDQERAKLQAFVRIALEEVQLIRNVSQDLYEGWMLENATGFLLDALGWIVGEARQGRDDDLYRIWIRIRIIANRSNGKIADSLKVARLLVEETATVKYVPDYPAAYVIEITNSAFDEAVMKQVLNLVRGAGIGMHVHTTPDEDEAFTLGAVADVTNAAHFGLSSLSDPTYGGILTSII
jgi:hypothetical protein